MTTSAHLKQFRVLAQYNAWVNEKLYERIATLTEEERQRHLGTFFHSIHGTLNHILLADRVWLGRFATGTCNQFTALQNAKLIFQFESLSAILYSDFEELWQERRESDRTIQQWMQELTPEVLTTRLHYTNPARGIEREHSLWFGLAHFYNHQTHHRGQITTLLHQMNQDYGVTDLLALYHLVPDLV